MGKVRLVVIAAFERDLRPIHFLLAVDHFENALKAAHTTK
jgi:hypothetical protein